MTSLVLRHNVEVAHRLWLLEGNKCQNIHGHSMWVELELLGKPGANGIMQDLTGKPLEFGEVKRQFRAHLDTTYDHQLLLNEEDPFAQELYRYEIKDWTGTNDPTSKRVKVELPGLAKCTGDPTTENIALWIAQFSLKTFCCHVRVVVHETAVNAATAFLAMEE